MLTISQIKDTVAGYCKDKPVKGVFLFGSYARGDANESSDIDLGIVIERANLSLWQYAGLAMGLEELLKSRVDVVQIDLMHEWLRKNYEKEKIELYAA